MSTSLAASPWVSPDARRDRFRRPLGVLVLAWWVVCLGILAWVGPWQSTAEDLQADLAAHRVAAWEVGTDGPPTLQLTDGISSPARSGGTQPYVSWRDTVGRVHWVEGDALPVPELDAPATAADGGTTSGTDDGARVQRLIAWLGKQAPMRAAVLPVWTTIAVGGLSILTFVLIVAGPRPTRGTRWFWFWFTPLPAGIAIACLAVSEYLRPAGPRPVTADRRDGRRSGWQGVGYGLLGTLVLTVAWWCLSAIPGMPQR